jgi:hypothetical protein
VDATLVGNSCSVVSGNGKNGCSVTCVEHENAMCSFTETTSTCRCLTASDPPQDTERPALR